MENVKDYDPSGQPRKSVTANNIKKVRDVSRKDRRLGVRAIAEVIETGKVLYAFSRGIEHENVCTNVVPKIVSVNSNNFETKFVLTFCNALRTNRIC